ncbi:MAG: penicillin-binding protein 1C [Chloroflexi bacterium]|nr:penicillin-binding protein 1C [Chloroflexota bacterium]
MTLRRHWYVWLIFVILALALAAGASFAALVADLPSPDEALSRAAAPSTLIFDRHGRLLYEVIDPEGGKHVPLSLEAFPAACRQATIATEDANFYRHPGVDLVAILRSAWLNYRSGETVSGASTLTQQVARTLLLEPEERYERSYRRKLREAWLAWRLERRFSKDELLALYLNQTYYGHFAYGMAAAAQAYFGKPVGELDLAECALLAGLPQYPAGYNPLENPSAAKVRQAIVFDLMVRHGVLTPQEAARAKTERLQYAATPFPIEAPHFVMVVLAELERDLGTETLRSGGLRVVTTLDLDWQEQAEAIVQRRLQQLADDPDAPPGRRVDNAALVVLDPRSGAVRVMLGSPDYFDARIHGAVNGALSPRQPGSAIKPLTYAAAFDPARAEAAGRAIFTPATLISDVRTSFPTREGTPYVPLNYDLRFHGPVLVRQALGSSFNVPAVKVLQHIGVDELIRQARELGITTFNSDGEFGLALTLGGGEVPLLELTAAFAAFANGGLRVQPAVIERVETLSGQQLAIGEHATRNTHYVSRFTFHASRITHHVLSPQVAYLITHILSDDSARIAGFGEGSVLHLTRPAAAKTGTTTDWRDNWTIGYTPELVVGVWVGNADNEPMRGVSGVDGAAPIWRDVMETLLRDRPPLPFPRPEGLVEVEICADSGFLPGEHCPRRRTELFIAGTEPPDTCSMHQLVRLDARTGQLADDATPPEQIVERVYFVLPADLQDWAREEGIPQPPRLQNGQPAVTDHGSRITVQVASCLLHPASCLVLTSPDPLSHFRLRAGLPRDAQRIEVAARPGDGVALAQVTLLADGEPLATLAAPPYRAWWPLTPGAHEFQAVGMDAEGQELASAPVRITVSE